MISVSEPIHVDNLEAILNTRYLGFEIIHILDRGALYYQVVARKVQNGVRDTGPRKALEQHDEERRALEASGASDSESKGSKKLRSPVRAGSRKNKDNS